MTTVDGVRIAYLTMGERRAVGVHERLALRECEKELERPVDNELFCYLARHHMVVRYDGRGAGKL